MGKARWEIALLFRVSAAFPYPGPLCRRILFPTALTSGWDPGLSRANKTLEEVTYSLFEQMFPSCGFGSGSFPSSRRAQFW